MLKSPEVIWETQKVELDKLSVKMDHLIRTRKEKELNSLSELYAKLDALNPLNTLLRGYSIVTKDTKFVASAKDLSVNDSIDIKMNDGNIVANVTSISLKEE